MNRLLVISTILGSCLMLAQAQISDSEDASAPVLSPDHANVFRDDVLSQVLSNIIGHKPPVQEEPEVITEDGIDRTFSLGGHEQQQQKQPEYGPSKSKEFSREFSFSTQFTLPFGKRNRPKKYHRTNMFEQKGQMQQNQQQQHGKTNENQQQNQQQYGQTSQQNQQQHAPLPQINQQQNEPQYSLPPQGNVPLNQQQYGPPAPGNQQQNEPQYSLPVQQQYGAPQQNQQQYGPPPQQQNQQQYGPLPQQQNQQQYGPPPPQQNQQQYGPPPQQQNQQQYGPPPPQQNQQQYGSPPQQQNQQQYGPPTPQQNQQQYGPPPQQQNQQQYGSPPQQQYGLPPQQQNQQQYGPPAQQNQQQYALPPQQQFMPIVTANNFNQDNSIQQQSNDNQLNQQQGFTSDQGSSTGGQRFVYVYAPPTEPIEAPQTRIIAPFKKPDKNYQIIFVKAPSPANQAPVEIQMPPPPEQKTLVYVLVKKHQKNDQQVRFISPPVTSPSPPEVFFVKYRRNPNLPSTSDANSIQTQYGQRNGDFDTERFSDKQQHSSESPDQTSQFLGNPRNAGSEMTSGHGSHYAAPGSTSWDSSSIKMESGPFLPSSTSGASSRTRLMTSNYIAPLTSDAGSSGGYQ